MNIHSFLDSFQRFGVNLGLERIETLLTKLGNPHHSVPIIHVGGTNGKGSVCAYLSSILTAAGYRVGRYTSPHLIDWSERICVNNKPIPETTLQSILVTINNYIDFNHHSPTQFEVITAAAWVYFAQQKVDIAVIEVGLGGRLDATNVSHFSLATVITSISRDHWQQLGPTITDIAREKAGIFKQNCPVIIGEVPHEAKKVFQSMTKTLNCPTIWVKSAKLVKENWAVYQNISYPLPLLGKMQLNNSALAIETIKNLQNQGWAISPEAIINGIKKTIWPGRLQWIQWQDTSILLDGAHNTAAAKILRDYVNSLNKSTTWIMGMMATKEHDQIFQQLLKNKDSLSIVPVPINGSANPKMLAYLAKDICPDLQQIKIEENIFIALENAIKQQQSNSLIVVCGSLYLIGHFLRKGFIFKS
ncbi:MAG: folylpolyglutamate synthase/dihydrofolate synthase family protein [Crocosphaera sp.]|nr:folylpolyglutamate synthase/dihydrofolate synthase family protein [Crocosphaera sp.]